MNCVAGNFYSFHLLSGNFNHSFYWIFRLIQRYAAIMIIIIKKKKNFYLTKANHKWIFYFLINFSTCAQWHDYASLCKVPRRVTGGETKGVLDSVLLPLNYPDPLVFKVTSGTLSARQSTDELLSYPLRSHGRRRRIDERAAHFWDVEGWETPCSHAAQCGLCSRLSWVFGPLCHFWS